MQMLPANFANSANLGIHLKLLAMALMWGASWPAGRVLAQAASPMQNSAWRFTIAVAILLMWLYFSTHNGKSRGFPSVTRKQMLGIFAGGLIGIFGYTYCFMVGLLNVPAGRGSLVVTFNPVLTTLLAAWLFHEKFNPKIGFGMVMAVLGSLIVLTHGEPMKFFAGGFSGAEIILLGCAICWSSYALIGKVTMQGLAPLTATTYNACVGVVFLWIVSWWTEPFIALNAQPNDVFWTIVFLAIASTVLAYAWYFEGIDRLGAGTASAYISLVPVFGVLTAWLWLNEPIDASLAIGGAIAVAGVLWMNAVRAKT